MNAANIAIAGRVLECWNKRDFSVIEELFPDCIYHSPVTGELKGEAYRKYFASLLNAFPDGRLTMKDQLGEDDKVAIRWSFTGTQKGQLMDLAPTDKQVTMTGISFASSVERSLRCGRSGTTWG